MARSNDLRLSRRDLMKMAAVGAATTFSSSGWIERVAAQAQETPATRRKHCILLWMNGGPSQTDTFDLKPGHANGGPFLETPTSVPGVRISEYLPRIARNMHDIALIRSMSTREGDHGRGTFLMRTGYLPTGPIQYPTMGSYISKEIGAEDAPLPNFVSIAPYRLFNAAAFGPGYLGPQYAPLLVADNNNPFNNNPNQQNAYEESLRVQDLTPTGIETPQANARIELLEQMERDFVARRPGLSPQSHATAINRAVRLMRTSAQHAFNLNEEPARIRDAYGRNQFGQGCLLARRLVERGVSFVEVNLGSFVGNNLGWDTHQQNFNAIRMLSSILDPAWGTLMEDLRDRGLLEDTLIVWMGEFGRTPRINGQQGRDHYPNAWTTVLAGGGIRGGQAVGRTSADGTTVEAERPTSVADLLFTVCRVLGINPDNQNMSNVGRPIPLVDRGAMPIREVIA